MRPLFLTAVALLLAACEREPLPENGAIPAPGPTASPQVGAAAAAPQ